MPDLTKNSSALSNDALSLMSGCITGEKSFTSPRGSELSTLSRASIQERFERIVLISPLWASILKGWASDQVGKVLVLKREWTIARALVKNGLPRSG